MKKIYMLLMFLFLYQANYSQEVEFKKKSVLVDGVECFKFDGGPNMVSIFDLEGNEILFLKFISNSKYADLYNKVVFVNEKKSFTSKSFIFTKNSLMKSLVREKVITNCKLNPDKVEVYVMKHDEEVEKESKQDNIQINVIQPY